ncbi:MAG TPA: TIGR03435 family protein [Bryobacteraceae bacterium]|jgi:uncharacterized protein (TIGR03435 family)
MSLLAATALMSQDAPSRQFDVASVKLSKDSPYGQSLRSTPGVVIIRNMEPETMIMNAYHLRLHEVVGTPDWATHEIFDVEAKADDDPELGYGEARRRNMLRLQALLTSRFQLKFHWETRVKEGYALSVGKSGAKLAVSTSSTDRPRSHMGHNNLGCKGCEMSGLAALLTNLLERPVVDETALDGQFDFELNFDREDSVQPDKPGRPSVFTAVKEQLGLKLTAQKVPVKILVVDRLTRPTAN